MSKPRQPIPTDSTPRERSLDALALMRRGYSKRRASDLARTDPRTLDRYVSQALRKVGGRWRPTPYDRIPRAMTALTPAGPEPVVVRDSRTATRLAEHLNAVARYIELGDEDALRGVRKTEIRIRGQPVRLVTDPVRLDRLAAGGELQFELYRT